jgi:chromosome segregation ATPase
MGPIANLGPVSGLDPCMALSLSKAIAAGDGDAIEGLFLDLAKRLETAEDTIQESEEEQARATERAEEAEGEKEDAEEKLGRAETQIFNLESDCDAALDFAESVAKSKSKFKAEAQALAARLKKGD